MPRLNDLKGQQIVICISGPALMEQRHPVLLTKLIEIEDGGVWIEGTDLADFIHEGQRQSVIPKMPIFFVPFSNIAWIHGSADYPSISEKLLGG
jgi:hypothetical protein